MISPVYYVLDRKKVVTHLPLGEKYISIFYNVDLELGESARYIFEDKHHRYKYIRIPLEDAFMNWNACLEFFKREAKQFISQGYYLVSISIPLSIYDRQVNGFISILHDQNSYEDYGAYKRSIGEG